MRIRKGEKWKTAFRMQYGYFEYQVMSFSLFNTSASFQDYIKKILVEKLDVFVIVYLNDILIYIKNTGQGYVKAVRWVLKEFQKYGLFANLKKCHFYQKEVRFLGYIISSQEFCIEEKKSMTSRPDLKQS